MSEFLAAAAAVLNAPEELVLRSAEAKAAALGGTADDYLAAWGGGAAAPAPAASAPPPPVEEVPAEPVMADPVPEPVETPVAAAEAIQPEVVVAIPAEPPPPPVDPAPLRVRRKLGGRLGVITGAAMGLVSLVALSPWLAGRADTVGTEGNLAPSILMTPTWAMVGLVVLFAVYGLVLASFTAAAVGWHGPGMKIVKGRMSMMLGGGLTGAVIGGAAGGVATGMFGTQAPGAEEVEVSLLAALVTVMLSTSVLGWMVGQLAQMLGVPEGMVGAEGEEAEDVRFRLGSALALPVTGLVIIAVLVLPAAYLFLSFPSWAPITGSVVAASILAFAGLSASRPGMRITRGEFLLAAAGIGVMVFILVAVLNTQGASHGESEDHEAEGEALELVLSN